MRVPFLILTVIFFSADVMAGECVQQAILHDSEYYMSEYCWTEGQASSFKISVWDSPDMVRVVARLVPGSTAKIVGKGRNFYKIKILDKNGDEKVGWISDLQIERIITKNDDSEACDY